MTRRYLEWRHRGSCTTADPNLFFPDTPGAKATREAKKICANCDVSQICLQWALDNIETGVWGGTSDQERKQIRHQLGIQLPTGWAARNARTA